MATRDNLPRPNCDSDSKAENNSNNSLYSNVKTSFMQMPLGKKNRSQRVSIIFSQKREETKLTLKGGLTAI